MKELSIFLIHIIHQNETQLEIGILKSYLVFKKLVTDPTYKHKVSKGIWANFALKDNPRNDWMHSKITPKHRK